PGIVYLHLYDSCSQPVSVQELPFRQVEPSSSGTYNPQVPIFPQKRGTGGDEPAKVFITVPSPYKQNKTGGQHRFRFIAAVDFIQAMMDHADFAFMHAIYILEILFGRG